MYPNSCLINSESDKIVVFEQDLNNPYNEGFIEFWEIVDLNKKQLTYKKRISKNKAFSLWTNLIKKGWKTKESKEVA